MLAVSRLWRNSRVSFVSSRAHSNPDVRCQCNFPVLIEEHLEPTFIAILTRFEVPPFFLDAIRKSVSESVKPLQLEKIMKKCDVLKWCLCELLDFQNLALFIMANYNWSLEQVAFLNSQLELNRLPFQN